MRILLASYKARLTAAIAMLLVATLLGAADARAASPACPADRAGAAVSAPC